MAPNQVASIGELLGRFESFRMLRHGRIVSGEEVVEEKYWSDLGLKQAAVPPTC